MGWSLVRAGLAWYAADASREPRLLGRTCRLRRAGNRRAPRADVADLRGRRIVPPDFTERFLDRLHEGKLDGGKALDYCEMNPSPAARVALAAVRRWGRPAADLERAVALAHRVESERLRLNVGTLRRIAALAPLLGVLGCLLALGRVSRRCPGEALARCRGDAPWPRPSLP